MDEKSILCCSIACTERAASVCYLAKQATSAPPRTCARRPATNSLDVTSCDNTCGTKMHLDHRLLVVRAMLHHDLTSAAESTNKDRDGNQENVIREINDRDPQPFEKLELRSFGSQEPRIRGKWGEHGRRNMENAGNWKSHMSVVVFSQHYIVSLSSAAPLLQLRELRIAACKCACSQSGPCWRDPFFWGGGGGGGGGRGGWGGKEGGRKGGGRGGGVKGGLATR